ncbi:MAG: hypothetical protein CML66_04950 [Rhodobacteraceae bacterium]|nr:hypothetical protein [Paracoccaceae bacterium]MAY44385.1 hypothetical protein [Paracoccaceae bacterium]
MDGVGRKPETVHSALGGSIDPGAPMHMLNVDAAPAASVLKNEAFLFARRHAFAIYPQRAIYTFIPKNACSTLRFSVAVANGFLDAEADVNWIHANNDVFVASQDALGTCDYAFVVLRCPFRRLASAYLDKIVGGERHLRNVLPGPERLVYRAFGRAALARRIQAMSFEDFLSRIAGQSRSEMDEHWRPQVDFLLFRRYDDYFALERFDRARARLGEKGLKVMDTRTRLGHDTSRLVHCEGDFAHVPAIEIKRRKDRGEVPEYRSLFSDRAIDMVREVYAEDIAFYRDRFGGDDLLF